MNIGSIPLETSVAIDIADPIAVVLSKMSAHEWNYMPVTEDGLLVGLIRDEQLWDVDDINKSISELQIPLRQAYLVESQHFFDGILFYKIHEDLPWIPVIDAQHRLIGFLFPKSLIQHISTTMSVQIPGAIIVLDMCVRDNALSHISQIVENNNAQILHSHVQTFEDSERLELTIKLNKLEISDIIATLLRYNYRIKQTYNDEVDHQQLHNRYEQLMNFINM